ncbi:MAG: hypothetical protein AAGF24_10645, partial [Cyanobacteria bacterium P01_H01_bin.121]
MTLANSQSVEKVYGLMLLKSFLLWGFTLIVCSLVIGFPGLILLVTVGSLLSVILQSVLPMSAVLFVAGGILSALLLSIVVASAVLTLRGIHPHDVSWLTWLNGRA